MKTKTISKEILEVAFSEPTKTVSFRCPLSKIDELKLYVGSKLSEWSQGSV